MPAGSALSACIVGIRREGKREDWIWQIILRHKDKGGEGGERKRRDKNNQDQFRSIGFMTMNVLTMISLSDTNMKPQSGFSRYEYSIISNVNVSLDSLIEMGDVSPRVTFIFCFNPNNTSLQPS